MMIVAIHQPNYLPYLGYFYKIAHCDKFVFLDSVQYTKHGFINRNSIKTSQGVEWLTVGVLTKGNLGQVIKDVRINNAIPWCSNHRKALQCNYARANYFKDYIEYIDELYQIHWEYLYNLNENIIKLFCKLMGIKVEFVSSSELGVQGDSTELLVNICKSLNADAYLSGTSGHKYMDESLFEKENIKLLYSEFKHPTYSQLWGGFKPNMSIVDLFFNEGKRSLEIINESSSI